MTEQEKAQFVLAIRVALLEAAIYELNHRILH